MAELQHEYSDKERSRAQAELDKAVKKDFEDLADRWRSEMDTLLVYVSQCHLTCRDAYLLTYKFPSA